MQNPILNKKAIDADFVNFQNEIIDTNITNRNEWETDCKLVIESYRGNKFPWTKLIRWSNATTSKILRSPNKDVYVNMIKRQYRVMSNYLLNNEPQYIITKNKADVEDWTIEQTREMLNAIFRWKQLNWIDDSFYDTEMDDIIYYGLFRGVVYTLCYYDEVKWYCFKTYDSLDCYVDTDARNPRSIRKFLFTYTKDKEVLKSEYPRDWFWKIIDWDNTRTDQNRSKSEVKQCMLVDNQASDTMLVREWYYLVREWQVDKLYRIITTEKLFLEKKDLWLDFMPITSFTPNNEPDTLFPRGWFVDMVTLERKINDLMAKLSKIIETWWRFVYVREWTVLQKGTSRLLNSLGIEVIEVSEAQELPQQATLLTINQSDIQYLNILMQQCEDEWWMKSDIMWNSSLWADASWKAIQALQAGSKNNIWCALNELNKYMTRIVNIVLKLQKIYWFKFYSEEANKEVETQKNLIDQLKIKVDITARSAFDEITQEMQAIQMLDYIQKFNPDLKIPPSLITQILWASNEYWDDIQLEIDKQIDPDLQIAEWENKKMMQWIPLNVNEADNHQLHMALHSSLLQSFTPDTPAGQTLLNHIRMHEAFMWWQQQLQK
jgi:hypothetical protein